MNQGNAKRIAMIGAGLMGHSIGQTFAQAGSEVILYDLSKEILEQSIQRIEKNLQELADWGLILRKEIESTLNRLQITTVIEEAAADADLVVEVVLEDLELKQRIFQQLDNICPERTILTSNASGLMPSQYASVTNRPDRVVGTHYFYPPHLIPLVEIARGELTSDATVETVYELLKATGKSPVIVQKEAPGLIANRLQGALFREALYIVQRGIATPQDVDIAVKTSFGRRLAFAGPFEMMEVQGDYEVMLKIYSRMVSDLSSSTEPPPVLIDKVKRGELGAKTGKGFYEWTPESLEGWKKELTEFLAKFLRGSTEQEQGMKEG